MFRANNYTLIRNFGVFGAMFMLATAGQAYAQAPAGQPKGGKAEPLWSLRPLQHIMPPISANHIATDMRKPEVGALMSASFTADNGWIETPIDRFILAKLTEKGIRPNPQADRRTLIRRVTFDLIGLPPTPEEVEAFVRDRTPQAYARLIDRLLASPHYGERWRATGWISRAMPTVTDTSRIRIAQQLTPIVTS